MLFHSKKTPVKNTWNLMKQIEVILYYSLISEYQLSFIYYLTPFFFRYDY